MISKKLYSENKVPPLTGFPLREGMENFDKPIERTDKSNTANIIDLIKVSVQIKTAINTRFRCSNILKVQS